MNSTYDEYFLQYAPHLQREPSQRRKAEDVSLTHLNIGFVLCNVLGNPR